jgi:hypothetical protein
MSDEKAKHLVRESDGLFWFNFDPRKAQILIEASSDEYVAMGEQSALDGADATQFNLWAVRRLTENKTSPSLAEGGEQKWRELALEAIAEFEDARGYASSYFTEKWGYDETSRRFAEQVRILESLAAVPQLEPRLTKEILNAMFREFWMRDDEIMAARKDSTDQPSWANGYAMCGASIIKAILEFSAAAPLPQPETREQ